MIAYSTHDLITLYMYTPQSDIDKSDFLKAVSDFIHQDPEVSEWIKNDERMRIEFKKMKLRKELERRFDDF